MRQQRSDSGFSAEESHVPAADSEQSRQPVFADGLWFLATYVLLPAGFALAAGVILATAGPSFATLSVALAAIMLAIVLVWAANLPHVREPIAWMIESVAEALCQVREDWEKSARDRAERQRKAHEELRRIQLEQLELAAAEARAREEAIAKACRPVETQWPSRRGVDASRAVTYGAGNEFVYCYTFPTVLEMAALKREAAYKIKVGMASGDPISRIREQISASKTAIVEGAVVLLVFQTHDCRSLEAWLHKELPHAPGRIGREWFTTNPDELLSLFKRYLERTQSR